MANETQSRYSTWRPDVAGPPESLLWTAVARIPGWAWFIIAACFCIAAFTAVAGQSATPFGFFLASFAVIPLGYRKWTRNAHLKRIEPLRNGLEPDVHPVRIGLYRNGKYYGEDVGLLGFFGSSLFFEGRKTTFSFDSQAGVHSGLSPNDRVQCESGIQVRWKAVGHNHALVITPLDVTHRFHTCSYHWNRQSPHPGQASVLPPIDPAPDAHRRRDLFLLKVGSWSVWFLAWDFFVSCGHPGGEGPPFLPSASFGWVVSLAAVPWLALIALGVRRRQTGRDPLGSSESRHDTVDRAQISSEVGNSVTLLRPRPTQPLSQTCEERLRLPRLCDRTDPVASLGRAVGNLRQKRSRPIDVVRRKVAVEHTLGEHLL